MGLPVLVTLVAILAYVCEMDPATGGSVQALKKCRR